MISHSLPTCKLDVELVLWLENLDVQGAIWSKVFHCPGSEDGLMILRKLEMAVRDMDGVKTRERQRKSATEREREVETHH